MVFLLTTDYRLLTAAFMIRTKKRILIPAIVVVLLFAAELAREQITFMIETKRLERTYWQLQEGPRRTKEEVRQLIGEPELVTREGVAEYWRWYAHNYRGPILKRLVSAQGDYELEVEFDKANKMLDVYSSGNKRPNATR